MGPIEASRENVREEPYTLPKGFEWDTMDVRIYLAFHFEIIFKGSIV